MFRPVLLAAMLASAPLLSGCIVAKGAVGAVKITGKSIYYAGKGAWMLGKGAVYVAGVPLKVTNAALDTSAKFLTVTVLTVDLAGELVETTSIVARESVDAELKALDTTLKTAKTVREVVSVTVDVAEDIDRLDEMDALPAPTKKPM
ncbi:MAG: hypothetical protein RL291_1558 [Pseudomonadota bacterium]